MTFAPDPEPSTPAPLPRHHEPPAPSAYFDTWTPPPGAPPRPASPPTRPSGAAPSWSAPAPMTPRSDPFAHPAPGNPVEEPDHDTTDDLPDNAAETLLRLATTHRSVPEVARMIAILGDCSGMAADEALREAAMTRPVSDLVLLADLLSNPTHAKQGRRPVEVGDPHRPNGPVGPGNAGGFPPLPPAFTATASPAGTPSTATEKVAGTALRWATAVGLAVSGLALGSAIPAAFRTPPYAAGWFALSGLVCLFLAGVTAVRAGRGTRLAALVAGCVTIATALVPRLVADAGSRIDAWGPIALGAGTLTALCAAAVLTRPAGPPDTRGPRRRIDFEPWEATMLKNRPDSTARLLG
ncbi:hypothetical protein ACIBSV_07070 [Embleya sp. NPDC050154]|uniref:hypothetical protein n=1 Tax=Embleya sp. NPDC050154 TaxID=3363988 RepID=UPI0037AF2B32